MLVCVRLGRAPALPACCAFVLALRLRSRRRQMDYLVVVVFFLEIFAIREEIEELELFLLRLLYYFPKLRVEKLLAEIVFARTASLDLDKICWRKDRPEQAEVQNIRAIVAGCHHPDGDAYPCLACPIRGQEISRAQQIIVGEIDGELLGVADMRGYLHSKIGLVLAGKHLVSHEVQYLHDLGGVMLAD